MIKKYLYVLIILVILSSWAGGRYGSQTGWTGERAVAPTQEMAVGCERRSIALNLMQNAKSMGKIITKHKTDKGSFYRVEA